MTGEERRRPSGPAQATLFTKGQIPHKVSIKLGFTEYSPLLAAFPLLEPPPPQRILPPRQFNYANIYLHSKPAT